jgi:hypothetical protein
MMGKDDLEKLEDELDQVYTDLEISRDFITQLEGDLQTAYEEGENAGYERGFMDGQKRAAEGHWV